VVRHLLNDINGVNFRVEKVILDLKAIPNSISDVPETNEAPTNHNVL
jgi:hypothetical protein